MDKILTALKFQSNCFHLLGNLIWIHAEIMSGHYKTRNISRGGVMLSDEEKLKHALENMSNHCRNLSECSENIKGIR